MSSVALTLPAQASIKDFIALTKPRVTGLVLFTALGGLWLAPGTLPAWKAIITVLATALGVGSANALNCYLERDVDALMQRTRTRPLPAGRLDAQAALIFGLILGLLSVGLAFSVNKLVGIFGAASILIYVLAYTPLKRLSPQALLIGAVPGALPPFIGWVAVTNSMDAPAWVLFAILFIWQLPHFMAISMFRQEDYSNAGFRVLPLVAGERFATWFAVITTLLLVPTAWLLTPLGVAGSAYGWVAVLGGIAFYIVASLGLVADEGAQRKRWARKLFLTSLLYLTALFIALGVNAI